MAKGYVYILSNPSMPGIIKIGKTTRHVDVRANELYQTGVPTPFKVEHQVYSPDCGDLEFTMHGQMKEFRLNAAREFFLYPIDIARGMLENSHLEQVQCMVWDYLPDHTTCISSMVVDGGFISMMADATEEHPFEVVDALSEMTIEEFMPIMERYRAKLRARVEALKAHQANQ